jgi:hypothetical protein
MRSDPFVFPDVPSDPELDQLLHPARAFEHPHAVVADPDLTLNEKRAILASWASDACAVEACPALRQPPGTPAPISVNDILAALRTLDQEFQAATGEMDAARYRRTIRRTRLQEWAGRRGSDRGPQRRPH